MKLINKILGTLSLTGLLLTGVGCEMKFISKDIWHSIQVNKQIRCEYVENNSEKFVKVFKNNQEVGKLSTIDSNILQFKYTEDSNSKYMFNIYDRESVRKQIENFDVEEEFKNNLRNAYTLIELCEERLGKNIN